MTERKTARRPVPCPVYDVEGTESWLTDLAAKGLLLRKDSMPGLFATFDRAAPQKTRYRLQPALKKASFWSEDGDCPAAEAQELAANYGWEYVTRRGQFYIYRALSPEARELDTDPAVQAIALNAVRTRQRGAFFGTLLWLAVYLATLLASRFFVVMLEMRSWYFLLCALIWTVVLLAEPLAELVHLARLKRQLLGQGTLDHGKNWAKRRWVYPAKTLGTLLLCLLWLVLTLSRWSASMLREDRLPLEEYSGRPPFPTMAELAGGAADYESTVPGTGLDGVEEWSDWLAPVNLHWQEYARITTADGRRISGGLLVDYHEAASPWLAERIAAEYYRSDRHSKRFEPMDCPETGAAFAAAYYNDLHFPTVVLQSGNRVLRATFYQTSDAGAIPPAQWIAVLAASLER